jgi:hypothetical protein
MHESVEDQAKEKAAALHLMWSKVVVKVRGWLSIDGGN